jgi:hypothetical protein
MRKKIIKRNTDDNNLLFSILIPTLFSRRYKFLKFSEKLMKQIEDNNLQDKIEIIAHYDNKKISLSEKRTNLLNSAAGKYLTFLDDDDTVSDDYIISIYNAIMEESDSDVISFKQKCNCDGKEFFINCDINYNFNNTKIGENIYCRFPWIWCIWKKELVQDTEFKDPTSRLNYGEDRYWLERFKHKIKKEKKIDKILHYYIFNSKESETQ